MKAKLTRALVVLAIIGASGYGLYTFGLNDEAKSRLRSAVKSVKNATESIKSRIEDLQGITMENEGELPNVQSTQKQWEALGF